MTLYLQISADCCLVRDCHPYLGWEALLPGYIGRIVNIAGFPLLCNSHGFDKSPVGHSGNPGNHSTCLAAIFLEAPAITGTAIEKRKD